MKVNLIAILILSLTVVGQCYSQSSVFFGLDFGTKYFTSFDSFNKMLQDEGHNPVNDFAIRGSIFMGRQFEKFSVLAGIGGSFINNRPNAQNVLVSLNEYYLKGDIGYNLASNSGSLRLEPVIGFGLGSAQVNVKDQSTNYSFNQVLAGAQNDYFDQSALLFNLNTGIKFQILFGQNNVNGGAIMLGFHSNLNNARWSADGLPLARIIHRFLFHG